MSYTDALIIFCCNSLMVLAFIASIEFSKQREKNIERKKQEESTGQN